MRSFYFFWLRVRFARLVQSSEGVHSTTPPSPLPSNHALPSFSYISPFLLCTLPPSFTGKFPRYATVTNQSIALVQSLETEPKKTQSKTKRLRAFLLPLLG